MTRGGLPYPDSLKDKRVRVVLASGEVFVDRCLGGKRKAWWFEQRGTLTPKAIRTVSIYRGGHDGT